MKTNYLLRCYNYSCLTLQFLDSYFRAGLSILFATIVSADVMGDSTGNITNMNMVIKSLRERGSLVSFEPVLHPQNTHVNALQISERDEPANILQRACLTFSDYTWERSGTRYRVFPAQDALSSTVLPSIAFSNKSLLATLTDARLDETLRKNGLFVEFRRAQVNHWRNIHLSLTFTSGSFATFLDTLSDRLGKNVSWHIEFTKAEPMRIVLGNQVCKRQSFILHFDSLTGEKVKSTQEILKSADMDELRRMLTQDSGVPQSEVVFELALRYWHSTNVLETTHFLRRAEDLAQSEDHKWQLRYRALTAGLGYPTRQHASEPAIAQHEAFVKDCSHAPTRHEALFWMLNEYVRFGQEQKARALIEAESKDREWQNQAALQYRNFFPNTTPINISQEPKIPPSSFIRTSVSIEKTSDGKLQEKKTTEKYRYKGTNVDQKVTD